MNDSASPQYSQEEINDYLQRHGIDPASVREVSRLFQEGNTLTAGKRRNIWAAPIYRWEVGYGKWSYQVGPTGCAKALTDAEGARLSEIDRRLSILLNGFTYDPHAMTFDIHCRIIGGTCHYCKHHQVI
jgi:hypothetical protein